MQRVLSHRVWLFWIVYSSTSRKKCLQIPCIFLSFKWNIIWTCAFRPVMSHPVEFISFAKKVAIDFCYFFLSYWGYCSYWNYEIKKYRSACSFQRKEAFISRSSLAWGKSLMLCMCTRSTTRSFAPANDAKIVRSRDARCNTAFFRFLSPRILLIVSCAVSRAMPELSERLEEAMKMQGDRRRSEKTWTSNHLRL